MISAGLNYPPRLTNQIIETVSVFDGIDTDYTFAVYDLSATPAGVKAVYVFAKIELGKYVPIYVGRAERLPDRLFGHERKLEAIRYGATRLLVHTPGVFARVGYVEAERRLIAHYAPMLNVHHNPLHGVLGA